MPHAGLRGHRFYYEVGGEGETIVLLHGLLANADIMEAPATGLASGFRALRIDRRGCGRSSPTSGPVPLEEEADDVAALLDWFSVESAHLLAHDEGAEVGLELALRHPGRVASLALLAPSIEGFPLSPEESSAQDELLAALRVDPRKALEEKWFPRPIFDAIREREGMSDRVEGIFQRFPESPGRWERAPRPGQTQLDRIAGLSLRTAILIGDRDERDRLLAAEAIADRIQGSELHTFPGLARFLHIEESRMLMRRLTDFLIPELEVER